MGPHRVGDYLGIPRSTVGRVLARYRMPLLHHLDQATGLTVRKLKPSRYQMQTPGQLVHVDVTKLGTIHDGGGWRKVGKQTGRSNSANVGAATHSCITRWMTAPVWPTPRPWRTNARRPRLRPGFAPVASFADARGKPVKHRRTRPYRPQTNGKAERFNRTLAAEWVYAETYRSS
jgi:transposase InsO family protein